MLKIKDDVDLKVLEKFGFLSTYKGYQKDLEEEWNMEIPMSNIISSVYIKTEDRVITLTNHFRPINNTKLDIIFDLIQVGLVEKVGE